MLKLPADTTKHLMDALDRHQAALLRYLDVEMRHIRERREEIQALCDHDWNDCGGAGRHYRVRRCIACGVWESEIPKGERE